MDPCSPNHHPALGDRATSNLDTAETVVVAALRCWVAPIMHPQGHHPAWQAVFQLAGVAEDASTEFNLLMAILAHSAQRMLEVRCCHCPSLGADEIAMLELVGSLQEGNTLGALSVLSDWLPPATIGPALLAAKRFSEAMSAAGLRVTASVGGEEAWSAVPQGARLH
ncbi:hypothetical protein JMJ55_29555 [Belnapia sp. T6]|uniref:Uncharacterized protein n=1 Tax=Belnapia mucosa TaxID=2804532 RepID=A0ABS1VCU1_9PROT|nr:hypothetical protein [Belnapia mucosa]MBL6459463.1 hypothetical protein [Belnapia mucosa]